MDILNFISWIRGGRQVTSVDPDKTLLPIGIKDSRRDDGYLAAAITVTDLANYICGGSGGTVQLIVNDIELPLPYPVVGGELITRCTVGPPYLDLKHTVFGIPLATITNYVDMFNWLTTNFNYPGYTWLLTGPSTIEVVIDTNLLVGNCQNPDQVFFNWFPGA
jgi:hypothetical protein